MGCNCSLQNKGCNPHLSVKCLDNLPCTAVRSVPHSSEYLMSKIAEACAKNKKKILYFSLSFSLSFLLFFPCLPTHFLSFFLLAPHPQYQPLGIREMIYIRIYRPCDQQNESFIFMIIYDNGTQTYKII